jgi:hypothetical protein
MNALTEVLVLPVIYALLATVMVSYSIRSKQYFLVGLVLILCYKGFGEILIGEPLVITQGNTPFNVTNTVYQALLAWNAAGLNEQMAWIELIASTAGLFLVFFAAMRLLKYGNRTAEEFIRRCCYCFAKTRRIIKLCRTSFFLKRKLHPTDLI